MKLELIVSIALLSVASAAAIEKRGEPYVPNYGSNGTPPPVQNVMPSTETAPVPTPQIAPPPTTPEDDCDEPEDDCEDDVDDDCEDDYDDCDDVEEDCDDDEEYEDCIEGTPGCVCDGDAAVPTAVPVVTQTPVLPGPSVPGPNNASLKSHARKVDARFMVGLLVAVSSIAFL